MVQIVGGKKVFRALLAGLTIAAMAAGIVMLPRPPGPAAAPIAEAQEQQEPLIPDVVDRVAPAVVSVYTSRPSAARRLWSFPFDSERQPQREQSLGSGVIVSSDGLILTNNHVVDKAVDIRVILLDRREFKAKVIGGDRRTDVALLKIDARDLATLPFGDSSKVRIGETVLAIGNPLGVGQTVSRGIVSAKGRANVGIADYEDFLQTDAAINPGNSGGALVNLRGELIGVNTAIASRTGRFEGIGFAIPSNMARDVMKILLKEGKVVRGFMGVMVQDMTPQLARAMEGAPERGVLVSDVVKDSPAEKAGLRRGDIVLRVDGEAVTTASQIRNHVALLGAGAEVRLQVWREREVREFTVKLKAEEEKAAPETEEEGPALEEAAGVESGLEGVKVTPATPDLLERLGLPKGQDGLVITSIVPSHVTVFSGLTEGDLVVEVNRRLVKTAAEMQKAVKEGGDPVLLTIRRKAGAVYLTVPKE